MLEGYIGGEVGVLHLEGLVLSRGLLSRRGGVLVYLVHDWGIRRGRRWMLYGLGGACFHFLILALRQKMKGWKAFSLSTRIPVQL